MLARQCDAKWGIFQVLDLIRKQFFDLFKHGIELAAGFEQHHHVDMFRAALQKRRDALGRTGAGGDSMKPDDELVFDIIGRESAVLNMIADDHEGENATGFRAANTQKSEPQSSSAGTPINAQVSAQSHTQ